MNRTETLAFDWLTHQGYKKGEIYYSKRQSPAFTTSDSKMWEAKMLYGNVVWMSQKEFDSIMKFNDVTLLVFNGSSEPILKIPRKEIRLPMPIIKGIKIMVIKDKKEEKNLSLRSDIYDQVMYVASKKEMDINNLLSYLLDRELMFILNEEDKDKQKGV